MVDGALDGVDPAVDGAGVDRGLVEHAVVDGGDDDAGKVGDLGVGPLAEPRLERRDGQELDLDGEQTKEADEEARERGGVEDVLEEPAEVDVGTRGEVEPGRECVGDAGQEGMGGCGVEHEEVVVGEGDLWRVVWTDAVHGGIGCPGLTGPLEMPFETAPPVPLESAVACDEEQGEQDQDEGSDFRGFGEVVGEVVDDGGVHAVAEREGVLLWDRKEGLVETDGGKGVVDVLFEQLKGRVQAKGTRSEGVCYEKSRIALTRH